MSAWSSSAPGRGRTAAAFVREAWPALAFGFLLAFSSSVGQSYFIGLFGAQIRSDLELSHGQFGAIYAAATLASAVTLLFAGKLADRRAPHVASVITALWLAGAAVLMAFVSHALMLLVALFALRLGGQGMMSHIALTTLARWFAAERGRAVALATLGFPAAEAALPPLAAAGLVWLGAGPVWLIAAAVTALVVGPGSVVLSRTASSRLAQRASAGGSEAQAGQAPSWKRAEVLKDPRFYAIAPSLLAAPFIVTGLVFHQARLVEAKGWTLPEFASLFPLFAAAAVTAGLVVGAAVDRFGSRRVLALYLIPLALSLLVLSGTGSLAGAGAAMAMAGLTAGGTTVLFGTIWAELYGPAHLGAIRSLAVSLMVIATALSPAAMGALIDAGVALQAQFQALAVYIGFCIAAVLRVQSRLLPGPPPGRAEETNIHES